MEFNNKIIIGDSSIELKKFPANSIDLIITSPPYFQQREYGYGGIGNESSEKKYLDNLYEIFFECVRLTKKSGSIVFNLGDKYIEGSLSLIPYKFALGVLEKFKLKLINNLTWIKLNPTPRQDKRKLVQSTEPFFIFVKSNEYYYNQDAYLDYLEILKMSSKKNSNNGNGIGKKYYELLDKSDLSKEEKVNAKKELDKVINEVKKGELESFRMKIRNIHSQPFGGQEGGRKMHIEKHGFTIIRIYGKSMKKDIIESPVESIRGNPHPAVYPEYVIQQIIKLLTQENDVVLDPFCGSGTTCVAAKMLKRNYIGIEINPEYVNYAQERLSQTEDEQIEMVFI
ncbi:MAG: site-specific DNA-methyltransferase [Bacteroidetes bacterium]|nr:site-specific DNA-methyltransferase [Bacteroidota bacterium]